MSEYRMPSLGADMEAGILAEWLVKPGDTVHRGQSVAMVETDKGTIEVEFFDEGEVDVLLVEPGTRVPVGDPIALFHHEGEEPSTELPGAKAAPAQGGEPLPPPPYAEPTRTSTAPPPPGETNGLRASPAARRRARELGVDIQQLRGTNGVVSLAEVEEAARLQTEQAGKPTEGGQPAGGKPEAGKPQEGKDVKRLAMRRAIAAAMGRSKREIPHYYLETTCDLTDTLAYLETFNRNRSVRERVLPAALFLRATALAVREVPETNGFWTDDAFRPADHVHLGVAIALREGGLIAPAIHDADRLSAGALMAALQDLIGRVRGGTVRSSEISDATITVTNLGDQGVDKVYGVIYPPQVALVGFGRVVERPWVIDGNVVARRVVDISLSGDHRASDGHRGGVFLNAVARLLREPQRLMETIQ